MTAKNKLEQGGFITNEPTYWKYNKFLDKMYDAIIDYGYVDRIVPEQMNMHNLGHKDTEEFCVFRVREGAKQEFMNIMKSLNIYLAEEELSKNGQKHLFFLFKSNNLPELRQIVRGIVKTKTQEMATLKNNMTLSK